MNYPDCKPGCGWFDCAYCRDRAYAKIDGHGQTPWKEMERLYGPMHQILRSTKPKLTVLIGGKK